MKMTLLQVAQILLIMGVSSLQANPKIDMYKIAQIESSNNPRAYNAKEHAFGMFQIRNQCLQSFNDHQGYKYQLNDMFDPIKAHQVAKWYLEYECPRLLRAYNIPVTEESVISCYNAGIGNVRKGRIPETTKRYIEKYKNI